MENIQVRKISYNKIILKANIAVKKAKNSQTSQLHDDLLITAGVKQNQAFRSR